MCEGSVSVDMMIATGPANGRAWNQDAWLITAVIGEMRRTGMRFKAEFKAKAIVGRLIVTRRRRGAGPHSRAPVTTSHG